MLRTFCLLAATLSAAEPYDLPLGNSFYVSNKVYTDPQVHPWATASPSSRGITATSLTNTFVQLKKQTNFKAFLVARDNALVYEGYNTGATATQSRNVHSASKSILSACVGNAIRDGKMTLNTTVGEALSSKFNVPSNKANITVAHLLAMQSGISWTEDVTENSIGGKNVIQGILNRSQSATPGTKSNYSTGDACLLAAVLAEKVGKPYGPYAVQEFLGPLGITPDKWGIDGKGYYSGGCNFFITPRESLRFGQVYCDAYNGQAEVFVTQGWAVESFTKHSTVSGVPYGWMWWLNTTIAGKGARAWGWGKNITFVWPEVNLTVVTTYDTANNVSDGDNFSVIQRYLLPGVRSN